MAWLGPVSCGPSGLCAALSAQATCTCCWLAVLWFAQGWVHSSLRCRCNFPASRTWGILNRVRENPTLFPLLKTDSLCPCRSQAQKWQLVQPRFLPMSAGLETDEPQRSAARGRASPAITHTHSAETRGAGSVASAPGGCGEDALLLLPEPGQTSSLQIPLQLGDLKI